MAIHRRAGKALFNAVHGNTLIYNTCWEDPRLDRVALGIRDNDVLAVITSAGCNVLDYLLDRPRAIHAIDMNPRQNALLELKIAGIRELEFEDFFGFFGHGSHPRYELLYRDRLRRRLSPSAQGFWDQNIGFFHADSPGHSFYFHGTSGWVARAINLYIDRARKLRNHINRLLEARTTDEQQDIYYGYLHNEFWTGWLRWLLGREAVMSLLGVPRPQMDHIAASYPSGLVSYIQDCLEFVFAKLPIADNYFWRVYLTGRYSEACCPEYLKEHNFILLKDGLVDRIQTHTNTLEGFLGTCEEPVSRFVLLDHMDWLSTLASNALVQEWKAILNHAAAACRIIWRSGGQHTRFVDDIVIPAGTDSFRLGERLSYNEPLARELHEKDRVHTYGSFHIADLISA